MRYGQSGVLEEVRKVGVLTEKGELELESGGESVLGMKRGQGCWRGTRDGEKGSRRGKRATDELMRTEILDLTFPVTLLSLQRRRQERT